MKGLSISSFILGFASLLFFASTASAALPNWTTRAKILDIRTDDAVSQIWVVLDGNHDISTCNSPPNQVFIATPSDTAMERKLSMIMTAMAADMDIQFWVEGCGPSSVGPQGKNVRIYKN